MLRKGHSLSSEDISRLAEGLDIDVTRNLGSNLIGTGKSSHTAEIKWPLLVLSRKDNCLVVMGRNGVLMRLVS